MHSSFPRISPSGEAASGVDARSVRLLPCRRRLHMLRRRAAAAWVLACACALHGSVAIAAATSDAAAASLPLSALPRGATCQRLDLPQRLLAGRRGLFNPAAARHPRIGWVLLLRFDSCYPQGCGGPWVIRPYAALLGRGLAPRPAAARRTLIELAYTDGTKRRVRDELGNPAVLAGDMRPFVWRGGVYLSHWLLRNNTPEVEGNALQAVSRLDVGGRAVRLVHLFTRVGARNVSLTWQKNWGFLPGDDGGLRMLFTTLPASIVLRLPADARAYAAPQFECGTEVLPAHFGAVEAATGLDLASTRNSGNPEPYPAGRGGGLLMLVHTRQPGNRYFHWGVRLAAADLRVTHISAGPLLKWNDYAGRGFLPGVVSVGSFHVLPDGAAGPPGGGEVLRVFFGEGDKFSCWEDTALDRIAWFALPAGAVAPIANPFA